MINVVSIGQPERIGAIIEIDPATDLAKPHTSPLLRPDSRGEVWTVEEDFVWFMDKNNKSSDVIYVPKGFESDLASIPKILQNIIPRTTAPAASVAHDYCYQKNLIFMYIGKNMYMGVPSSRKRSDYNFKLMLKACGISSFKANMMYAGLRAGGWKVYNNYAAEGYHAH